MATCPKCHHTVADDAKFCGNCAAPMNGEEGSEQPAEEQDAFIGKCIDNKYYITRKIAAGGMGVVYLAMQKGVGQEVAIKKLHAVYYQNPTIVERFINEARSYGKISHPNAVKLHDLLNVGGQICIVMEYVKGRTLTQYLESGYVFSTRQIVDICLQLADALGTVHRAGIIHRDLKTENVMLLETVPGRFSVKILDFGIAKMLDKPMGQQTTEAGLIVGTPEFMAPEQCFGYPVDHRVDIYAFGVLMYVMICGRLPFVAESQMAVMQLQISQPLPPMERPDKSEVIPGLEAIVVKCLMKKPEDRYQSFTEVVLDLECIQEGKQTRIALSGEFEHEEEGEEDDTSTWRAMNGDKTTVTSPDVISVTPAALREGMTRSDPKKTEDLALLSEREHVSAPKVEPSATVIDKKPELSESSEKSSDSLGVALGASGESETAESGDDEGFSLGDLDEIPEELHSTMPASRRKPESGKNGLKIIVAVLAVTILVMGSLWGLEVAGVLDLSPVRQLAGGGSNQPEAQLASGQDNQGPVIAAVDEQETASDSVEGAESGNESGEELKEEEVEPSHVPDRANLDRGVMRALLEHAQKKSLEGFVEEAARVLDRVERQKNVLMAADQEKLVFMKTQNNAFMEALSTAEKEFKSRKCEKISALTEGIPEEAQAVRAQIEKRFKDCKAALAAVPTKLDDF